MAKGSWSATTTTSELAAAGAYRGSVIVQLQSGDPTWLAFGEDAVVGEGLLLKDVGDFVEVKEPLARLAINGICDTANSSDGGYQTS